MFCSSRHISLVHASRIWAHFLSTESSEHEKPLSHRISISSFAAGRERNLILCENPDIHGHSQTVLPKPLEVTFGAMSVPHPEKVSKDAAKAVNKQAEGWGGEDAYFCTSGRLTPSLCCPFLSLPKLSLFRTGVLAKGTVVMEMIAMTVTIAQCMSHEKWVIANFHKVALSLALLICYFHDRYGIVGMGVADGVYAWKERGIDAGMFSRSLMARARSEVDSGADDVVSCKFDHSMTLMHSAQAVHNTCY